VCGERFVEAVGHGSCVGGVFRSWAFEALHAAFGEGEGGFAVGEDAGQPAGGGTEAVGGELLVLGQAGWVVVVEEQDDQAEEERAEGLVALRLVLAGGDALLDLHGADGGAPMVAQLAFLVVLDDPGCHPGRDAQLAARGVGGCARLAHRGFLRIGVPPRVEPDLDGRDTDFCTSFGSAFQRGAFSARRSTALRSASSSRTCMATTSLFTARAPERTTTRARDRSI